MLNLQGLVGHGASLFLEDDQNFTACDIAELNKQDAVAAFLEAKMVFNDMVGNSLLLSNVCYLPYANTCYQRACFR